MQWLPTYLSRNLGANKESISLTAMPYIVNSLVGIGKKNKEFDLGHFKFLKTKFLCKKIYLLQWPVISLINL